METMFKLLSVFISNEGDLLLFSKGVHWEAKNPFKISAFSIVAIVSPDISIGCTERVSVLFRELFKMV